MYSHTHAHMTMPHHERGNNHHIRRNPADPHCQDPDELKPFKSMDMDNGNGAAASEVHYREPKKFTERGCCCYLSRTALGLIGLLLVVLIILVGVIVALVLSPKPCVGSYNNECSQKPIPRQYLPLEPALGALNSSLPFPVMPKPTIPPDAPWGSIRLPRTIVPSIYEINLKIDLSEFMFYGSVAIDVTVVQNTRYIVLHANKLNIERDTIKVTDVHMNGDLDIEKFTEVHEYQYFVIHMRYGIFEGRTYRVHIRRFMGELSEDLSGLYRSQYKDKNGRTKYLAASQLQPVDARKVFPCFDEPDLKANFTVSIQHKREYTALSNMPQKTSKNMENGWVTDIFQTSPLMSTYLLAIVVAEDFSHNEITTPDGFKIKIWSQPDMVGQCEYALEFAQKVYAYFNTYFETPEVVPKADHVAIPDFSAGAMENWGLVLYRETALLHDDQLSAESNKYWVSLIMAHEISHSWFGNMVTMRWWDDLWLNEGFANTLMYFALDGINKHWNVLSIGRFLKHEEGNAKPLTKSWSEIKYDLQLVDNVYPVMTKDSLLTSHAISTPIQDPDDIPQFFDSISYDKGMAVLRMLRGFLGWDEFHKGLKLYVKRYKYGNAEMSQLWQTFSEVVNYKPNVTEVMNTWTRQMGFPVVTVKQFRESNRGEQIYLLSQERFLLNPEDNCKEKQGTSQYRYMWEIPFTYRTQVDSVVTTKWLHSTAQVKITIPAGNWILGNVDYFGFYRTNYDDQTWRRIIAQLHSDPKVFSAANRAGLISDAFNLARANKLSYEVALNLSLYLHQEDEYVPWRAFLDSIHFIDGMISTSNSYGLLQRYIRELVTPLHTALGVSDQGELLERNLRKIIVETAASVNVPPAVEWAKNNFESWVEYNTRIPADYASVIYSVGVSLGGEKEWDYMWEMSHKSRVASEADSMMSALGATQQPWLLWRYARWTLDSTKVRMQDVRSHFQHYANTPLGRSVSLSFLLTHWNEINDKYGVDVYLIRDVIYAITSLVNTEFEYNQLKQMYEDRPPAGVAKKAADNSLALIRSNINWRKLHYNTIHNWLEKYAPPLL